MNDEERVVTEHRLQKVDDQMKTSKQTQQSWKTLNIERIYVNYILSYPHDDILLLFRKNIYFTCWRVSKIVQDFWILNINIDFDCARE